VSTTNVITNPGRLGILNAIAGKRLGFAESLVVGIGRTTATVDDESLVFEVAKCDINTAIVDPVNEKIYFKGVLPINDQYEVHELGCYPSSSLAAKVIN